MHDLIGEQIKSRRTLEDAWNINPIGVLIQFEQFHESRITTTLGGEKCLQALDGSL